MSELGIASAARLSGKSQATIRRWASQNIVPASKNSDGRWKFDKDYLLNHLKLHSQDLIDAGTIKIPSIKANEPLISALEDQIKHLEVALDRERWLNDELREQLRKTTVELFTLTQEIKAILSKESSPSPTRWLRSKVQEIFTT